MAVLEILKLPDERLKQVSEPVDSFDRELNDFVADLEETRRAGPAAVGIAAPQVGRHQRILIVDVSGRPKTSSHGHLVLINPEITHCRQKAGFFERDDSEAVQTATDCQEEAPVKNRPAWFQEEQSE
jgi:peptide deformylase